jgi:hypothetical protein
MSKASEAEKLTKQAEFFSRYLVGGSATQKATELYVHALQTVPGAIQSKEKKLLDFMMRNPWSVGFVDAGLAMVNPKSEIRRRVYTMFCILEATPEYADKFLPQKHSLWYLPMIGLIGLKGVIRSVIGVVLVKVVR